MYYKYGLIIWIILILFFINFSGCFEHEEPQPPIDNSWLTIYDEDANWGWIESISWSPDNSAIAMSSFNINIEIWSTITWQKIITLVGHNYTVGKVMWSPDGNRLASISLDGTIRIWNSSTWECTRILTGNDPFLIRLAWNNDGSQLAASNFGMAIARIWDTDTWEILQDINEDEVVESISWNQNGEEIALATNKRVKIFNTITWEIEKELIEKLNYVYCVSYSSDGTKLASVTQDGTVKIWHTATWENIHTLSGYHSSISGDSIAWSPDAELIAIWPNSTHVDILNTSSWLIEQQLIGHSRKVNDLSWSPDGLKVSTGADEIKIWNITR